MAVESSSRKRASLHTLGCRLNQSETQLIADQLVARGYELVPFGEAAELGIVNTCTVTREADAKSRQLLRGFIRKNPQAFTAVIGCYSQMGYKALAEIEGVDLIVGNQEKLNVLAYVDAGKPAHPIVIRDRIERDDFAIDFAEAANAAGVERRTNLKIQDGCDFMCTFCVIPFARGRARSRALPNLLDEARSLVRRGARELVLTGVNVGAYEWQEHGIVAVVDALDAIKGLDRIRISSIEPTTIPEALFARMADEAHALLPYLHIPLQSGSDAVLARMKRRYTRAEFLAFIETAAQAVPHLCIGTDIMVGMAGETEEDFAQTCSLLREGPLHYAHVFKYSERAGTPAVRFGDKVSAEGANRRSATLRRISAEKRCAFDESQVGRTMPVLFEMQEQGYWTGYTGNYVRVAVCSKDELRNVIRPVRLCAVRGDIVLGELDGD